MVSHPLSPTVEDEATALEHEHVHGISIQSLKSDNDPVVSRGAVDQYPIIVDSDDQRSPTHPDTKSATKYGTFSNEGNSSDDSTGPATPPPLFRKEQKRPSPAPKSKNVSFEEPASSTTPKPAVTPRDRSRGRPPIAPIETELGSDLHAMVTGARREPSPYSYSRKPITNKSSTEASGPQLSPASYRTSNTQPSTDNQTTVANNSPVLLKHDCPVEKTYRDASAQDHVLRTAYRTYHRDPSPKSEVHRYRPDGSRLDLPAGKPSQQPSRSGSYASTIERQRRQNSETDTMTPPRSRRSSRESIRVSSGEERQTTKQHSHSDRQVPRTSASPHASPYASADESRHRHHSRQATGSKVDKEQLHRPTSQRTERIQVDNLDGYSKTIESAPTAIDDTSLHTKDTRLRNGHFAPAPLLTPQTADPAKFMEDDFARAFKENYNRKSKRESTTHRSNSNLPSPLTSPPRTPTFDRENKDYFEPKSPRIQTPQRSRPPSMDEGQFMELKSHGSLLSAATAGAAIAARSSADLSRSGASSAERSSSNSNSKAANTPRSRRPSPVFEETGSSFRTDSYHRGEAALAHPSTTQYMNEGRPVSRGNSTSLPSVPPPIQRAYSYAGQGHTHSSTLSYSGVPMDPRHSALPTTQSIRVPQLSRANEPGVRSPTILQLPNCPRSVSTSAHRDWTSIKEMSNIDICPTCANVLMKTRFHDLFVPSLPRPYNEPSVCAMSKPWLRIAFMQSLRQGRPNLDLIALLSKLPEKVKPCGGEKPDLRIWWELIDPSTKGTVQDFTACSACVRAIDIIFPSLEQSLIRPKSALNQEKLCSLRTTSKHFPEFIDHFEQAAARCYGRTWRNTDLQPLADHIRKATRYPECPRDKMLTTRAWHFMPELPEFTICEECFEEVVWPINDRPIARDIFKTTRLVPLRRNSVGIHGISCQLYSERMRRLFREAVASRNLAQFREIAKTRQAAQQRLVEMNKLYEQDQKYGIDRRAEIEKNNTIWRTLE